MLFGDEGIELRWQIGIQFSQPKQQIVGWGVRQLLPPGLHASGSNHKFTSLSPGRDNDHQAIRRRWHFDLAGSAAIEDGPLWRDVMERYMSAIAMRDHDREVFWFV